MWETLDFGWPLHALDKRTKAGWSLRSFAVRLVDGRLLVVSPVKDLDDEAFASLAKIGEPAVLFAPNHFHHLGLPQWRARFPNVRVVASERAIPRLRRQQPGVTFEPLAAVASLLPDGVRFVEPPGLRNGEAWLRIDAGRGVGWVVSDAFTNVTRRPTGLTGFFLTRAGVVPGLCIGFMFRRFAVGDRATYRAWLAGALDAEKPTMLAVGHGEPLFEPDLATRLRRLAGEELG